jgi:diacylglycerol kinase family enzyme
MYKLGAVQGIFQNIVTRQKYNLSLDGQDYSDHYGAINIGNTSFNGGNCSSNPYALPNDGWLNIVTFKGSGPIKTIFHVTGFTTGQFEKYPKIMAAARFKEMKISSEDPMYMVLDGEAYFDSETSIKVLPDAVRVVAPEGLRYRAYMAHEVVL